MKQRVARRELLGLLCPHTHTLVARQWARRLVARRAGARARGRAGARARGRAGAQARGRGRVFEVAVQLLLLRTRRVQSAGRATIPSDKVQNRLSKIEAVR